SIEKKIKLITKYEGEIELLKNVSPIQEIYPVLIENKKIKYNEENILTYFSFAKSITLKLITFIESNISIKLNFMRLNIKENEDVINRFFNDIFCNTDIKNIDKYEEIVTTCGLSIDNFNTAGILSDKFSVLIINKIIVMNEHNLIFIRNKYTNSLYDFIRFNFEEYVQLMNPNIVKKDEIIEILQWENDGIFITDNNKIKLISTVDKIKLENTSYSNNIMKYILNYKFDSSDYDWIFNEYDFFDESIKLVIREKAIQSLNNIISNYYKSSSQLKIDIMKTESNSLNENQFVSLYCSIFTSENEEMLASLIADSQVPERNNYIELFGKGDHIIFKRNDINRTILIKMKEFGYIMDFVNIDNSYRADKSDYIVNN
ncbi:MAG: hypothetical protein RR925_05925, partial [Erysipelotrichaceae bacterium]